MGCCPCPKHVGARCPEATLLYPLPPARQDPTAHACRIAFHSGSTLDSGTTGHMKDAEKARGKAANPGSNPGTCAPTELLRLAPGTRPNPNSSVCLKNCAMRGKVGMPAVLLTSPASLSMATVILQGPTLQAQPCVPPLIWARQLSTPLPKALYMQARCQAHWTHLG